MNKIKKIESNYISYAELCQQLEKSEKYSLDIFLEYDIAEEQWYLKHHYKKKKVKKETVERFFSASRKKSFKNTSSITNVFKKAS